MLTASLLVPVVGPILVEQIETKSCYLCKTPHRGIHSSGIVEEMACTSITTTLTKEYEINKAQWDCSNE